MATVVYECISCRSKSTVAWDAPQQWHYQSRPGPRVRCPACGAACCPEPWIAAAIDACLADERLGLNALKQLWSACPNAGRCLVRGQYAGDCEEGLPARPKCLVALYEDLESLNKRLDGLAGKAPGRRAKTARMKDPIVGLGSSR